MSSEMTIGFIGNPNCGKTTLFNAYTGARLKVANWAGVTVEKVEGAIQAHDCTIHLVDLPGTYSLTAYTMEEIISRQFILSDEVDVVINVVDASTLERSLYLTLQLLELGKPVIVALNMMDIVEKRGMELDLHRLPEMLGVPVIPICARKRAGLDVLLHAAIHHKGCVHPEGLIHEHRRKQASHHAHNHHTEYTMVYSDEIEDQIDCILPHLKRQYPELTNPRWYVIKMLEQDADILEHYPLDRSSGSADFGRTGTRSVLPTRSYESEIINQKYAFIGEVIDETLLHKQQSDRLTEAVDAVLTDTVWGIPIFLAIMALVFFLTFAVGDWIKGYFEQAIDWVSAAATGLLTRWQIDPRLISLIVEGAIGGVGTIITFLPNIFILFLALAFLEDSGYMSRVAYVMEGIMSKLGLSGKAFIPMLLGFGCTVPALMASRALENKRDRYKVMLVTPFMSCNARLTIYLLFAEMFFAEHAMLVAYSMYVIGIVVAILVSLILHLLDRRTSENYLIIELPSYKMPDAHTVAIYVWDKVVDYLDKAGTTIFAATLLVWLLLHFGPQGYAVDMADSFGALVGKLMVPLFTPIGLGFWQIVVALIAGISAKEVVVSSCAVLFGIVNASSPAGMAAFASVLGDIGFGALNAFCLMVFCLLYVPCAATLATIHRESNSWAWTGLVAWFQMVTAWVVTLGIYRVGLLL